MLMGQHYRAIEFHLSKWKIKTPGNRIPFSVNRLTRRLLPSSFNCTYFLVINWQDLT